MLWQRLLAEIIYDTISTINQVCKTASHQMYTVASSKVFKPQE